VLDRFDFHLHTCCSDGEKRPAEVLALASRAGLAGISITDHDTIAAYDRMEPGRGGSERPRILAGIEISASCREVELHLLGYFPDGFPPRLSGLTGDLGRDRLARIQKGIRRLGELGVEISWEEVVEEARGGVISRAHLAQLLVRKRYVSNIHAAFSDLLKPENVLPPAADAREIVKEISGMGGVPIWAHPPEDLLEEFLDDLVEAGLAGVELYIPRRRPSERKRMAKEISRRGLLASGGSDWHGHEEEDVGTFTVQREEVEDFLKAVGW